MLQPECIDTTLPPLVSVVVPSYNQAHYLPMALDSVMFQDYPNIELLLCNHGSTDATSATIAAYVESVANERVDYLAHMEVEAGAPRFIRETASRFPLQGRSLRVFESRENIGPAASFNVGFQHATGKYCMYLVGDDTLLPQALTSMVAVLEKTDADVVYADMHVIDDKGRILQRLTKPEYDFETCFARWFHLGVCRLYRRELHQRAGWYDPEFRNANDYDMFLRFAMAGARFRHLNRVLYNVRVHDADNPDEPASWRGSGYQNLLDESVRCAKRARAWQKEQQGKASIAPATPAP